MEVLKTGEALESEILEDARRKAARILDAADKECAQIRKDWEREAEEERKRKAAQSEAQVAELDRELAASLPLDLMRARLAFIQEKITTALKELFDAMSPAELAGVLRILLQRATKPFQGTTVVVSCAGMDAAAASRLVKEAMPGVTVQEARPADASANASANASDPTDKGILVTTVDGRLRYRATLGEVTVQLLEEHREELVTALLGKDV